MNLPVAGVMHQPEIREVVRAPVVFGPHVVHVDVLAIVESLMAARTAPVLPPGELPRRGQSWPGFCAAVGSSSPGGSDHRGNAWWGRADGG